MKTGMSLTGENYFSPEAQATYLSASQFKAFLACEAAALAEARGDWRRENTTALLVGSYVDAHFAGELPAFKERHPDLLKRDGGLRAEYRQAEQIIARIEREPMMRKYLSGRPQAILTGEIAGVPFKIKMDAYHPGRAIADLKIMRDFSSAWNPSAGCKVPWWETWGYDWQAAIYQEVERQSRGQNAAPLPFYLVAATKEQEPDVGIWQFEQTLLDRRLEAVRSLAPHYAALKRGEGEPVRCGVCPWCRRTKQITGIGLLTGEL